MMNHLQCGKQWVGEVCQRAKNGEIVWGKTTMIPFLDDSKKLKCYMVIAVDITEEKMMGKWKSLACRHELTNLPNRRMFDVAIESYVMSAKQNGAKLAVLFLDINKFKKIKDRYGHIVGDHFLREVGSRLTVRSVLKDRVFHKTIVKYANDAMLSAKRDQQKSFMVYM